MPQWYKISFGFKSELLLNSHIAIPCLTVSMFSGTERYTEYGCEGSRLDISCPTGQQIEVVRANFGRFSISICNEGGNTSWSVNCMQPRTMRVINTR